jgi:hypothetical protein
MFSVLECESYKLLQDEILPRATVDLTANAKVTTREKAWVY